ncbi:MAG: DNA internalization-related competence protein ComEC/Rec2 [Ruminococcaceae bacterium]|nr:DNA internalization-related competence protein ComEC/Rec2 [Oscillospiraceae bacterium]
MRKLAIFSSSFALAAAAYVWLLSAETALLCAIVLIVGMLILLPCHTDPAKRTRIACGALAFGLLWSYGYEMLHIAPMRKLCGENVLLRATVCAHPEKTKYGCRVEAEAAGGTVLIYLNEDRSVRPGDELTLRAEVCDVSRGGESENLYFQSKDISLLAFQNEEAVIRVADGVPAKYLPTFWVQCIREQISKTFPEDTGGFMRALLTGDKSGMDYQVQTQMSVTGLAHVFSVSGMHVSLLVGFFMMLIRNKHLAATLSVVAMLIFAAMLGFSPSVTRAVIMNAIVLLAPILQRENDAATTLSFALFVILIFNPWAIASISLQLSFLAMAGIFLFARRIYVRTEKFLPESFGKRLLSTLCLSVATSLSATSLTIPLMAVSFGSISLIAPFSNLLLLNLVAVIFTAGFAILPLSLIPGVGTVAAWLLSWPIRFVLYMIGVLAGIPFAAVYTNSDFVIAWLVIAYFMFAVFLLLRQQRRLRHLAAAVAATLLCAVGFGFLSVPESSFLMFDVGQGQMTLLQSGNFTVMVDCGGENGDVDGETAARCLLTRGQSRLDALILTHYDDDHTGGVEQLLSRINVQTLFLPDISDDSGRREEILLAAERYQTPVYFVTRDISLEGYGASVQIWTPMAESSDNEGICALMSLGEYDILITGDMSKDSEYRLLESHSIPPLEVLVAGHHGSKHSTSEILLERTRPAVVLISVGENRYGHPAAEVLSRIEQVGAAVFRTDENGDIFIVR